MEEKDVLVQLQKEKNVSEEYLMAIMEEDEYMKGNTHTLWDKTKAAKSDAGAAFFRSRTSVPRLSAKNSCLHQKRTSKRRTR